MGSKCQPIASLQHLQMTFFYSLAETRIYFIIPRIDKEQATSDLPNRCLAKPSSIFLSSAAAYAVPSMPEPDHSSGEKTQNPSICMC